MIEFHWSPKEGTDGKVITCHKPQFDLEARETDIGAEWSVTQTADGRVCASGKTSALAEARLKAGGWVFDFFMCY